MSQNDEVERIKRIRDQQIRARDPEAPLRKRDQRISQQLKTGQRYTLKNIYADIPSSIWWMLGMALLAMGGGLGFMLIVREPWSIYVLIFLTLFGAVIGRIIGQLIDKGKGGWTQRW